MLNLTKTYTPAAGQKSSAAGYNTDMSALFNALAGLENQTKTLGGLTITPSSNGKKFIVTDAAGVVMFSIDSTSSTGEFSTTYGFFHDRGDPAAYDFSDATLNNDGNWHDMDLSSIVPVDTKAVLLGVVIRDNNVESSIKFRKNGNTNVINIASIETQAANVYNQGDLVVACDENRLIEYNFPTSNTDYLRIVIKGWWK